jgi:hypothetical protein
LTLLAGVLSASSNNSTLNDVEPGLLGFLVVFFIGVALVFLLRSMNKQFRKLPPPEDAEAGEASEDEDQDANAENAKRG